MIKSDTISYERYLRRPLYLYQLKPKRTFLLKMSNSTRTAPSIPGLIDSRIVADFRECHCWDRVIADVILITITLLSMSKRHYAMSSFGQLCVSRKHNILNIIDRYQKYFTAASLLQSYGADLYLKTLTYLSMSTSYIDYTN